MPNKVKRIGKRIKELSKNPGYVATEGAKLVNSMYDTIAMQVAMKNGGTIRRQGKLIKEKVRSSKTRNRIKPDSVIIRRKPPRTLKKGKGKKLW